MPGPPCTKCGTFEGVLGLLVVTVQRPLRGEVATKDGLARGRCALGGRGAELEELHWQLAVGACGQQVGGVHGRPGDFSW